MESYGSILLREKFSRGDKRKGAVILAPPASGKSHWLKEHPYTKWEDADELFNHDPTFERSANNDQRRAYYKNIDNLMNKAARDGKFILSSLYWEYETPDAIVIIDESDHRRYTETRDDLDWERVKHYRNTMKDEYPAVRLFYNIDDAVNFVEREKFEEQLSGKTTSQLHKLLEDEIRKFDDLEKKINVSNTKVNILKVKISKQNGNNIKPYDFDDLIPSNQNAYIPSDMSKYEKQLKYKNKKQLHQVLIAENHKRDVLMNACESSHNKVYILKEFKRKADYDEFIKSNPIPDSLDGFKTIANNDASSKFIELVVKKDKIEYPSDTGDISDSENWNWNPEYATP